MQRFSHHPNRLCQKRKSEQFVPTSSQQSWFDGCLLVQDAENPALNQQRFFNQTVLEKYKKMTTFATLPLTPTTPNGFDSDIMAQKEALSLGLEIFPISSEECGLPTPVTPGDSLPSPCSKVSAHSLSTAQAHSFQDATTLSILGLQRLFHVGLQKARNSGFHVTGALVRAMGGFLQTHSTAPGTSAPTTTGSRWANAAADSTDDSSSNSGSLSNTEDTEEKYQTALSTLANEKELPELFNYIHRIMVETWPSANWTMGYVETCLGQPSHDAYLQLFMALHFARLYINDYASTFRSHASNAHQLFLTSYILARAVCQSTFDGDHHAFNGRFNDPDGMTIDEWAQVSDIFTVEDLALGYETLFKTVQKQMLLNDHNVLQVWRLVWQH